MKSTPNQQHAHTKCLLTVPMTYMDPTEGAGTKGDREKTTGARFNGVLACGVHSGCGATETKREPQSWIQDSTSSQIVAYTRIEAKIQHNLRPNEWKGDRMAAACRLAAFGSTLQSFRKSKKDTPRRCPKPMNCLYVVPGVCSNTSISACTTGFVSRQSGAPFAGFRRANLSVLAPRSP